METVPEKCFTERKFISKSVTFVLSVAVLFVSLRA